MHKKKKKKKKLKETAEYEFSTFGGVGGRGLVVPTYPITKKVERDVRCCYTEANNLIMG